MIEKENDFIIRNKQSIESKRILIIDDIGFNIQALQIISKYSSKIDVD